MTNPYQIEPPALISFSGGRTSGYMLRQILDAYGGRLPDGVVACFANTGKEMPQTLDFVQGVRRAVERGHRLAGICPRTARSSASFASSITPTASRRGEPYEALLRERKYLPNPVTRFCTTQLKIRVMRDYARSLGWDHWTNAVGLRFDEPRRVARIKDQRERWETTAPLFDAGATKEDVAAFWRRSPSTSACPTSAARPRPGIAICA